jgi:hypothetical protein
MSINMPLSNCVKEGKGFWVSANHNIICPLFAIGREGEDLGMGIVGG